MPLLTRAAKGAALTHQEMDGNLEFFDLREHLITEAEFNARAAANRDKFAGSGFVEWGLHGSTVNNVNEGMWAAPTIADILVMAGSGGISYGTSKTGEPVANINGYELHVRNVNESTKTQCAIKFPPTPATAALTDRQDLVFLETWHEDVSTKDIVYPNGCIQSLLATDPATGLTTVNGSFTGFETYSLFGNWQSSSALIGKGLVWSTMSDANKKLFVTDPENNCYLVPDGSVIQVRYRVRVIEGLGADWNTISPSGVNLRYSDPSAYVVPKGSATSITNDMDVYAANGSFHGVASGSYPLEKDYGTFATTTSFASAYNGLCFATPIALVSRRNQGAFHPVWNPNGTASGWRDDAGGRAPWYSAAITQFTSVTACFVSTTDSTGASGGYDPATGLIGSTRTADRPDGKFYDAIYESDVLDLRNSSHKQELTRTLEREFNKLVAGEQRGWEGVPFTTWGASEGNESEAISASESKTPLWCDLIGSYTNLKAAFPNGVAGHWLKTGEEGENLIPDGTSKSFKASRKSSNALLQLWSTDSGVTWNINSSPTIGSTNNLLSGAAFAPATGRIDMWFYDTEASPFELASNAEALKLGDVSIFLSDNTNLGCELVSHLINKIPDLSSSRNEHLPLSTYHYHSDGSGFLSPNTSLEPQHDSPKSHIQAGPAGKILPYLTRENGKLFLQALYKEMKHNGTSWGDDAKFNVVDNESTTTDDNAATVLIGQKRLELPYFIGDGE